MLWKFDRVALFKRIARLPLAQRRVTLWALWQVLKDRSPTAHATVADHLEMKLSYPRAEALRISKRHAFLDLMGMLEWATFKFRSTEQLIADGTPATVTNKEMLGRLAGDPRPIIVTPLHMGAYILAICNLMYFHFTGRKVLIVRNHADREEDTVIMQRLSEIGSEVRFLNIHEKDTFVEALRFARRDSVVVCFVDLPGSYGSPVDVELFNRPANLAMGIEVMARALNATVLPFNVRSYLTNDVITIGTPFEVGPPSAAERKRVTNIITRHIQDSVLAEPEQWHMLARLEEFMGPVASDQSQGEVRHAA